MCVPFVSALRFCFSMACGFMLSTLIGLGIQSHISYYSSTCDENGLNLETGNTQCVLSADRAWSLTIFYCGGIVFLVGTVANCANSIWNLVLFMFAFLTLIVIIVVYAIGKTSSDHMDFIQAIDTIKYEVIRDKWDLYSDILNWVLVFGPLSAFILASLMIICYMFV